MMMPTYERRYFINLLLKQNEKKMEHFENQKEVATNSKGTRKTKVSGEALKSRLKNGDIPLN